MSEYNSRPLGKTAFAMEYSLKSVSPDDSASESDKKFKDSKLEVILKAIREYQQMEDE